MFRHPALARFLAGSRSFLPAVLATALVGSVASVASAQPAAPVPSASAAPKDAPVAPASPPPPGAGPSASGAPANALPPQPPAPQAAPAPAAEAKPALSIEQIDAQWKAVYERGKAAMTAGAFPMAARMLNDVAKGSPDPMIRAQAFELGKMASYWTYNRLTLTPVGNTLPPGEPRGENQPDKRSIDELAILYGNSIIWGTGFGITIGIATNGDASAYFLSAIGMSAVGAGVIAYIDNNVGPFRYGVPQAITSGMYMGLEAGIFMSAILVSENAVNDFDEVIPPLIWGSATAGALIGGLIGSSTPVTPGRASFTSSGALWGGLFSTFIFAGVAEEFSTGTAVAGLVGATAGGITTGLLAKSVSPSIARVRFLDLGGFAGGLVAGGLYASIGDFRSERAFALLTGTGIAGGLALTALLTKDMDPDPVRRGEAPKTSDFRMMPFMSPAQGGGTFGAMGTF